MQSPRALGIFALAAVILAAISFAAVDISLSTAFGDVLPPVTVVAAIVGTVALLASVLPAITWFVDAIHARHDADIEPVTLAVRQPALAQELGDDEL